MTGAILNPTVALPDQHSVAASSLVAVCCAISWLQGNRLEGRRGRQNLPFSPASTEEMLEFLLRARNRGLFLKSLPRRSSMIPHENHSTLRHAPQPTQRYRCTGGSMSQEVSSKISCSQIEIVVLGSWTADGRVMTAMALVITLNETIDS